MTKRSYSDCISHLFEDMNTAPNVSASCQDGATSSTIPTITHSKPSPAQPKSVKKAKKETAQDKPDVGKLDPENGDEHKDNIIRREPDEQEQQPNFPDPEEEGVHPDDFLASLVEVICGFRPRQKPALSLQDFFTPISEERIAHYDMVTVAAGRENDVSKLQSLYDNGQSLDCCNRFGESLLHMACRRGFAEMAEFLLETVELSVRIQDDCGRNPFHDALWAPQPQVEICQRLVQRDPALLLIADKRGSTPFQYARPQDWPLWRKFLLDEKEHLVALKEVKDIFGDE